jgi:hypothetical protein
MKHLKVFENFNKIELNSNFWKWFDCSKTIKDGNIITYFHGTDKKFNTFDYSKIKEDGFHGKGFYFYNNDIAKEYYGNSIECYLKICKPYNMYDMVDIEEINVLLGDKINTLKKFIEENIDYGIDKHQIYQFIDNSRLKELGYDGIIHGDVAVVFYNTQIKSVKNNGDFSTSPNIYK